MRRIFIAFIISTACASVSAQTFIDQAMVEYEVKTNVKKTMGSSSWAEMLKDQMPDFKTGYFHLTFSGNKSVYKWDHWDGKKMPEFIRKSDEEHVWYTDFNTGRTSVQKNIIGSNFNLEDSIRHITWSLSNESRVIAGFNCRKAVGRILDSVYVFAFYSEEIMIPAGPCSINGLPGLILGMTIPRMYTSWIATSIQVNGVDLAAIKPVPAKKPMTWKALQTTLKERITEDGNDDPDSKKWIEQMFWNAML